MLLLIQNDSKLSKEITSKEWNILHTVWKKKKNFGGKSKRDSATLISGSEKKNTEKQSKIFFLSTFYLRPWIEPFCIFSTCSWSPAFLVSEANTVISKRQVGNQITPQIPSLHHYCFYFHKHIARHFPIILHLKKYPWLKRVFWFVPEKKRFLNVCVSSSQCSFYWQCQVLKDVSLSTEKSLGKKHTQRTGQMRTSR